MTVARLAREKRGISLQEAARSARVSDAYLKRIERSGGCSYPLACRLARLYQCSASVFLMKGSETPKTKRRGHGFALSRNR